MLQTAFQSDSGEKLRLGQLARHPLIERLLYPARKHFETDYHVWMLGVQRCQRLQLPPVVFGIIVHFTQQHYRALGGAGNDIGHGYFSLAGHGPASGRRTVRAFPFLVLAVGGLRLRQRVIEGNAGNK